MPSYVCDFKAKIHIIEDFSCNDGRVSCEILELEVFSKEFDTQLEEGYRTGSETGDEYLPMLLESDYIESLIKDASLDEYYEIVGIYTGEGTYDQHTGEHDYDDGVEDFKYVKYDVDKDGNPVIISKPSTVLNPFGDKK